MVRSSGSGLAGPGISGNEGPGAYSFAPGPPSEVPPESPEGGSTLNWGLIRPQIFIAIICATIFSVAALIIGMQMDAVEIVTAVVGSFIGFLGGVSLKVIERE
tara:strand:+ start:618 stop:926 length:309 start_codon:yes stop_codon:yes gene_type:complete